MSAAQHISTRKLILRFAAILILVSVNAFSVHPQRQTSNRPAQPQQQKPAQQQPENKEPSLKETQDWLKETIMAHAGHADPNESGASTKVEYVNFEGCTFIFKERRGGSSKGGVQVIGESEIRLQLMDIDTATVRIEPNKNYFDLKFNTIGLKPKIKAEIKMTVEGFSSKPSTTTSPMTVTQATLSFMDEEMTKRVSKALTHAIKLCQANKQPF